MMSPCRAFLFCLPLLLTACGGGGTSPSSSNSGQDFYLFFTGDAFSGSLNAIDPDDPGNPIEIEPDNVSDSARLYQWTYNAATKITSNARPSYIVYAKGGRLYRVSAAKGDGLIPVQVSSRTMATRNCGHEYHEDWATPLNSVYLYASSGADAKCGTADDPWKMVRIGMSSSEAPIALPIAYNWKSTGVIRHPATGALLGFLGMEGGALYRYDADFANPAFLMNAINVDMLPLDIEYTPQLLDKMFFEVEDSSGRSHLYAYDIVKQQLSNILHTSSGFGKLLEQWNWGVDNTHFYFADNNATYRVPLDASEPSSSLVTEVSETIGDLTLHKNAPLGTSAYGLSMGRMQHRTDRIDRELIIGPAIKCILLERPLSPSREKVG